MPGGSAGPPGARTTLQGFGCWPASSSKVPLAQALCSRSWVIAEAQPRRGEAGWGVGRKRLRLAGRPGTRATPSRRDLLQGGPPGFSPPPPREVHMRVLRKARGGLPAFGAVPGPPTHAALAGRREGSSVPSAAAPVSSAKAGAGRTHERPRFAKGVYGNGTGVRAGRGAPGSHVGSFSLQPRVVGAGHGVPGIHVAVHAHGDALLRAGRARGSAPAPAPARAPTPGQRVAHAQRPPRGPAGLTCSELSREPPGFPMHFRKHLSVILCGDMRAQPRQPPPADPTALGARPGPTPDLQQLLRVSHGDLHLHLLHDEPRVQLAAAGAPEIGAEATLHGSAKSTEP